MFIVQNLFSFTKLIIVINFRPKLAKQVGIFAAEPQVIGWQFNLAIVAVLAVLAIYFNLATNFITIYIYSFIPYF